MKDFCAHKIYGRSYNQVYRNKFKLNLQAPIDKIKHHIYLTEDPGENMAYRIH